MYDICVIGGGPAGLTAALYSLRAGHSTLLMEEKTYGGQMAETGVIENMPGSPDAQGWELAMRFGQQVDSLGVTTAFEKAVRLEPQGDHLRICTDGDICYEARRVILAMGVRRRHLDVPGEQQFTGRGVGWCAVCDGAFYRGKSVAVVGGGNTAMDAARLAKRSGAKNVTLVYRRTKKYMPADEHELALALQDGVAFAELAAPVAQADGVLKCEQMKLGEADASGRRSPVGTGEFFTVPCDLVISAVGEQVDDALMSANGIELDKKGRPAFKTNVAGVYAAGDATRGPATVVEGIADAARFAEEFIGAAHTYDIHDAAYVTKADAIAKKGTLLMSKDACCEGKRCLQCHTVCENCVDSCPNRANVAIAMADGSHQIVHVGKMCN